MMPSSDPQTKACKERTTPNQEESYLPLPITVTRKKRWKRSSTKFLVISDLTYFELQTNNVFSTLLKMLRKLTRNLKRILTGS